MWTRGMCVLLVFLHVIAGSAAYVSSQRQILQGGPVDPLPPPLVPLPVLQQIVSDEQPAVSSAISTLGPPVLDAAITTLGQTINNAPLPNAAQQQQPQQQPQQQLPPPQLPQLVPQQQQPAGQQPPQVQQAQQQQQAAAQPQAQQQVRQQAAAQPQAQQPLQRGLLLQPGTAAALADNPAALAAAQQYVSSQGTPAQQQALQAVLQQQKQGTGQGQAGQGSGSSQGTTGHTSFTSLVKPNVASFLAIVPTAGIGGPGLVSPSGAPQIAPAPGAQLGGCVEAGITLAAGPCMPFVAPFAARTTSLAKLSDTDFQQAVALGPTPSNQCCMDAGAFVQQGCACDARMAAYGPRIGLTPAAITLVAKAAVMACPHYHIVNPCK